MSTLTCELSFVLKRMFCSTTKQVKNVISNHTTSPYLPCHLHLQNKNESIQRNKVTAKTQH